MRRRELEQIEKRGILVISLDFELYWGIRDQWPLRSCQEMLIGARRAVSSILELFSAYEIHATWATVGFLFCSSRWQLLQSLPERRPQYNRRRLSPYLYIEEELLGADEQDDPYHYAPSLLRQILSTPHQRIGTHTFSHYYCLEDGQTLADFDQDLTCAVKVAAASGVHFESIVFPRNQCNPAYLSVCAEHGIQSYRGNQPHWLYEAASEQNESLLKRGLRLVDAYCNVSGHNCYHPAQLVGQMPCNIPASRFLRPYGRKLALLEPLRQRRIMKSMEHAARHGMIYHLWWHPHNFGNHLQENLDLLRRILDHYAHMSSAYGMISMNMEEVVEYLQAKSYPFSDSNHSA
ncbi:polysaccharide deacetylase family protein [Brevibacillus humidisoli]|uniref:polysaccharide deacetylase family protein n=1 Tax=Brevibacillus humidisoli TaxID=2895522 RepID=UPI001E46DBCD|nr:polysaccharide deacetylase family protein [Brevibacillus humidisoli]UFJ42511.1 polysaccharide deacetylase family protein [Brevibacillus humidisoli]